MRKLDPKKISFCQVRAWLDYFCPGDDHDNLDRSSGPSSPVPNFIVIDCTARKTILAPEWCTYAALSYVWGDVSADRQDKLFEDCPATIEDAIRVTLALDIHFLWVDRYCIDHENANEKHEQIQSMHKIYEGAHVTIIAAAGNSPDYGLPGVSRSRISPQQQFHLGSRCLISTLRNPRASIH